MDNEQANKRKMRKRQRSERELKKERERVYGSRSESDTILVVYITFPINMTPRRDLSLSSGDMRGSFYPPHTRPYHSKIPISFPSLPQKLIPAVIDK